jgi:ParB/RepB/Spo0J family partition protein
MAFTLTAPKNEFIKVMDIDVTDYDLRHDELGDLEGLMASIRSRGLMNAIKVRPANGRFELIHGRRRYEAVKKLGSAYIPATVEDVKDQGLVLDMLIENFQREDLSPRQKARAFAAAAATGMSQKKIADAVGTTQPTVSKLIAILDLPEEVLDALDAGGIKQHEAEELLRLKEDPDVLLKVFNARGGVGTITYKVDRALTAMKTKENKTEERQRSDDEIKEARDAASLHRAMLKAVRQADEARAGAVQKAARARTRRDSMLSFTVAQFIRMAEGTAYYEAACDVLGVQRVDKKDGFGQVRDLDGWLATNVEENPLRMLYTIALVRGHMPLVGAKDQLIPFEAAFAERTLEQLQSAVGYDVSLAERSLITGEEFKRVEVNKSKTEVKATAPAKPKTTKLPGSKPATERDVEGEAPADKAICPVCEGMATVVREGSVIECPNPNCEKGWIPVEPGTVESSEGEGE